MKTLSEKAEKSLSNSSKGMESSDIYLWANRHRKNKVNSEWQKFRLNKAPYNYPFLENIYTSLSLGYETVVQKPTQVGVTELAINATFFFLDKKGESVLYMLPNDNQLGDFTQARIDPVVENSPYLKDLFSDVSRTHLKRAGDSTLYLRGSNSLEKLEEIPVGFIVRDELDNMDREGAQLALKRLGASQKNWQFDLSHPKYPGGPIDEAYQNSSRAKWYVECPNCGEEQTLDWDESFYSRGSLGCRACSEDWDKEILWSGHWKHETESETKGYKFNQLLSPTVELNELKDEYEKARNKGGFYIEQFHNTVLAKPYAAEGRKLTTGDVEDRKNGPRMGEKIPDSSVMGVDVGTYLHWWVQSGDRVVAVGKTDTFQMLQRPLNKYNVAKVVIDAMPETKKARDYIRGIDIDGWLCRRSERLQSERKEGEEEIKVNATEHHDNFMAQFNEETIILPRDLPDEAKDHLTNPVRVLEETKNGKKARWKKGINHHWDGGAYALEAQKMKGGYTQTIF